MASAEAMGEALGAYTSARGGANTRSHRDALSRDVTQIFTVGTDDLLIEISEEYYNDLPSDREQLVEVLDHRRA